MVVDLVKGLFPNGPTRSL